MEIHNIFSVKRLERGEMEEETISDAQSSDDDNGNTDLADTAALSSGKSGEPGFQDAPFDVRAFDRIDLEGDSNNDGISESVIFSEPSGGPGGDNCSSNPHFRGGPVIKSLNGSVVHYRDELLHYGLSKYALSCSAY